MSFRFIIYNSFFITLGKSLRFYMIRHNILINIVSALFFSNCSQVNKKLKKKLIFLNVCGHVNLNLSFLS